jgi:hypothetical protein
MSVLTSAPASCLPAPRESRTRRLLRRVGDWLVAGHRAGLVSAHATELDVLAAFDAHRRAADAPTAPDEVRDAYRLWFGSDRNRFL